MCGSDTTDPLASVLFRKYHLTLLRTAFLPDELSPGHVVASYPPGANRSPVVYPLPRIVDGAPPTPFARAPFVPIALSERSLALEASVAMQAAGILGETLDIGELEAALKASRAQRFHIALEAAYRSDLDLAAVEQALLSARLSDVGRDLVERGCGLHLVTRTVAANQVTLESDSDLDITPLLKIAPFVDGQATAKVSSARKLSMQRSTAEMVIGFAALRLIEVDDELRLAGLHRHLSMRGDYDRETTADYSLPDAFADDSLFAALERAD